MTVTDIAEARARRQARQHMADQIADFAMGLPQGFDIRFHPEFARRFPAADASILAAAQAELDRRLHFITETGDISKLPGRRDRCAAAVDWLLRHPHVTAPLSDREFCEAFGDLSRAEALIVVIELRSRI